MPHTRGHGEFHVFAPNAACARGTVLKRRTHVLKDGRLRHDEFRRAASRHIMLRDLHCHNFGLSRAPPMPISISRFPFLLLYDDYAPTGLLLSLLAYIRPA